MNENNKSLPDLGRAPEFRGISTWFNTAGPLSMAELRGKVVLVDFWTYTCINCVRTLPHVTGWHEKYKDKGLVIVGVHTPEFAFEKKTENVQKAIRQFNIKYPAAQDNDYLTWEAYSNRYWPAEYLIDAKGHIRRTHFGEGGYDDTETAIRRLLEEAGSAAGEAGKTTEDQTPLQRSTPETYLGSHRMDRLASEDEFAGGLQTFILPASIPQDHFAYGGTWDVSGESASATRGAVLEIRFEAQKVFLVISPKKKGDRVNLLLDGQPLDNSTAGADVHDGQLTLDEERLYELVDLGRRRGRHLLRLEFLNDGTKLFAFTFG